MPGLRRHLEGDHCTRQPDHDEQAMAHQVIARLMAGVLARFGRGDGSGVDHHQADGEQRGDDPGQHGVVLRNGAARRVQCCAQHDCLQLLHRSDEHFRAMQIVPVHVETGAGGRHQHRIAGLRILGCDAHRFVHVARLQQRLAAALQRMLDQRRIAPDQHRGARMLRHRCFQRRKILSLAVAAEDDHSGFAQALQRRFGGADVGALGVVVIGDTRDLCDFLHAMRQALKGAQCGTQRL